MERYCRFYEKQVAMGFILFLAFAIIYLVVEIFR